MPDGVYWCPSCGKLNAPLRVRVIFVLFVVAILAGFGIAKAYVSYLRTLQSTLAQRWYQRGDQALLRGYPSVASDDYRNALGYAEGNREYRMKLAEALMKEGRLPEAKANLLTLWAQDPANAQLNLELAQVYALLNKPELAIRYYRAAIDGVWASDPVERRIDTRLELVHYLMQRGENARASAELISIQAEAPDDPAVNLHVGDLLLKLGENSRAARSFDAVLKENAKNVDALSGAGQAALAMGDYRKAVHMFTTADTLTGSKPGSPEADKLKLAQQAYDIDPYLRNLTISQRANRVAEAFNMAMERLRSCASRQNMALSPEPVAIAPAKVTPALPGKQNSHVTPIVPQAAAPDSLQLLYNEGVQRQPVATADVLRRNPDSMPATMNFVFEVMRSTEDVCPPQSVPERALQMIARYEGESQP